MADLTPKLRPIPDATGFQITPTLHTAPNATIDPSKTTLPSSFAVCILGASRGIGASIAYAYALAGARTIIIAARTLPALNPVATKIHNLQPSTTILTASCDVSSAENVAALAEKVKNEVGRLDAVIVNAAYYGPMITSALAGEPQDFQRVIDTNVLGIYHAAHFLIPLLLSTDNGAKAFVAISSIGAWMVGGEIAHTAVCISKHAQVRLIEMLAEEFKASGLLAVAVHPGFVITEMSDVVSEEWRKSIDSSSMFQKGISDLQQYLLFSLDLTDDPNLCGAFCVWLTTSQGEKLWLSGRFLSAKWDVDELVAMEGAIVGGDMLKSRLVVS